MKKTILSLFFVLTFCLSAQASDYELITNEKIKQIQKQIDEIGFNILNSNGIEKRVVFDFNIKRIKNAYSRYSDRQIVIYRDLYNRLEDDDEIASVLSHEISHSVDSYDGILRGYFSGLTYHLSPKKYELKADKVAVDYMAGANYNPVALIVMLNKAFPERRFEWCSTHPLTSRRTMEIYKYIYKKYPEYLVNNKYKNNPYYQNFLLTSKDARKKFQKQTEAKGL